MKFKKPVNENYCGTIVSIQNLIPLENCDNIVHTNIFGNLVIVPKTIKIGDRGVFFPLETQLSKEFLSNNNLFSSSEMNIDKSIKGYFGKNGRIRAVKLRGNKSMGLFLPLSCLKYLKTDLSNINKGDYFDFINDNEICKKFVVSAKSFNNKVSKKNKQLKNISKIIPGQFNFHIDTSQLGKNIHKINPNSLISITSKWHGTSLIISNTLTKRKLSLVDKIAKVLGASIRESDYSIVYSSRRVIKNETMNPKVNHFYKEDIWKSSKDKLEAYLKKGMTFYAEIVGYLKTNAYIQKGYDYGCKEGEFKTLIYRITNTNSEGVVQEFSAKQVQDFCKENGLEAVKQLYYGYAKDLFSEVSLDKHWNTNFLERLKERYLEGNCEYCINKVPSEGIVLRVESNDIEVYKLKSFRFYERETKQLDKGECDIEESN